MTTTKTSEFLNRLTSILSRPSASVATPIAYAYTYNDADQRTRVNNDNGSFWLYGYDAPGQLIAGKRYSSDWTAVAGPQYEYAFDDIGNRTATKEGGDASGAGLRPVSYTANALSQYTSRDVPGYLNIFGIAHSNSTLTVNSSTMYRKAIEVKRRRNIIKWSLLPLFLCNLVSSEAGSPIRLSSGKDIGFIDGAGRVVIPFRFEKASEFSGGFAAVMAEGQWTIIDTTGAGISTNRFHSIDRFSEGLAPAEVSNKWGFINSASEWAVRPRFARVRPFSEGVACGELPDGWHYIDRSGRQLAGPFQAAYPFRNGLGLIVVSNRWAIIGGNFELKIPHDFEEISIYEPSSVRVKKMGKWGILDSNLHRIVPVDYDWVGEISEGVAAVRRDDKWGWVRITDRAHFNLRYEFAGKFAEGRAAFRRNGKFGFVDRSTRVVIVEQYDEAKPFSEGTAWVRSGAEWGAIDLDGRLVIPMRPYVSVSPFRDGIAIVASAESLKRSEFLVVNRQGKIIWPNSVK